MAIEVPRQVDILLVEDNRDFAKLVDVFPDGLARNVCEGIRRARYRNGTAPEQAALLPPGEVAGPEM